MPRPRSLDPARIAAAALAVIDRAGLPALSMHAVAKELGMSTMALYRYVDSREELEGLVVELVLSTVEVEPPSGLPWRGQLTTLVERVRDAVAAHPQVVPLTLTHRHRSPSVLRWSEAVLRVLTGAGVQGVDRVVALRGLLAYVIGAIQLEHLGPLSGPGTVAIAGLPRAEFPHMAETARLAGSVSPGEEFRRGLDLLLRGLDG
ncbi:TetR family transcriptional regulator [Microtetraspora sp. NBRC 13810]|uniref:TetR/AcrR family transcriptional regulator n=1 Tax=Microtetraspora sp. NBRC 13810 TaxID=3030990 RepID=UPI0024A30790|nr:TetR/AcrR family transcriptional regulator C-terminal domain-containing protein [Microtetraspora sp. NBRC 13810]GLW09478.1 TetR family transcriptional regulator [Microtetraspora sp. NBRC 13810]